VAVTLENHHRGSHRASDGEPDSEVDMRGTHDVRKVDLTIEFAAKLHRTALNVVMAAFLILGHGDGFPPSA
jgi:hypothetical protein